VVTDRAFLPWCATTLLSCARATRDASVHFHVLLSPDVSPRERQDLARAGSTDGATVCFGVADDKAVAMLPSKGASLGGRMSWIRVVLPDALPDVDRVVYLDADTFVRQSLLPLWNSLGDAPIGAVTNVTERAMYPHLTSLGIDDAKNYFNAGVLVIDLAVWREERVKEQLIRFAASRPLPWYDQDALNVVFAGRWKRLHPKWNAMNSLWVWPDHARRVFSEDEVSAARKDPAVIHFEGPPILKPWHYLSQHPFRDEYRAALGQTAWANRPLQERTLATRLIAGLPAGRRLSAYVRWKRLLDPATGWRPPGWRRLT
jgi:lipopolysaccharide biosynthesis glycosyltransferase